MYNSWLLDATTDELYTDFTVEEILSEFEDTYTRFDSVYDEIQDLQREIDWVDNFDPEDCEDEDEWAEFEEKDKQLEDMRDELYELKGQLEEIEIYHHRVQNVVERVCGMPKYYVMTSDNVVVSGPHFSEPPRISFPQKVVKVYPNSILMSEEILNEERNARQW